MASGGTSRIVELASLLLIVTSALGAATVTHSSPGTPDRVSLQCLQCHDGRDTVTFSASGGSSAAAVGHRNIDHPIGMRYADYPARLPSEYRRAQEIAQEIELREGKVGCVSCHRPRPEINNLSGGVSANCYSTSQLARDAHAGGLCLGCHLM